MDFTIQRGYKDRESAAVILAAPSLGLTYQVTDEPIPGTIPIGTVEWCLPVANFPVQFFPDSLYRHVHRWYCVSNGQYFLHGRYYIKDLSGWKTSFETRIYPSGHWLPDGQWFISKPVQMVNEWRYYVVNGEVITTGWYRGQDEDKPAPEIDFPSGITGAVDFAETPAGLELIECHAPFACGWYGEHHVDYVLWMYFSWIERISHEMD